MLNSWDFTTLPFADDMKNRFASNFSFKFDRIMVFYFDLEEFIRSMMILILI